ncbi:hypothetical protein LTR36_006744 [Oleoguttula mirabilis]|uniref:Uncharacterized protein n=1 Tax=Oleoguttula mirabilis TaxID=1507867 RepID=A0AAV9JC42_9PEZI|nr:hypothetical protein LTR36_006744 [Oleoguttula mirabilis]
MGARFDRWLARPSTLHLLRQLVGPLEGPARPRPPCRASSTAVTTTRRNAKQPLTIRRLDHTAEEALALSAKELGLHMSLRAGVPFFGRDDGQATSLGDGASFDTLRYQADVAAEDKRGTLLVDEDEHKHNLRLWVEILHFRQRLDGLAGVVAVWQGMRGRDIDLPTEGEEADILWTTFVRAIIGEQQWARDASLPDPYAYIVHLKERTGRHYEKLYDIIIGSFFRVRPGLVRLWHRRLSDAGLVPPDALRRVAKDAMHSHLPVEAFKVFRQLYAQRQERSLYDCYVGVALEAEDSGDTVFGWHRFLLKNSDGPSQEMFACPDVQRLFELDKSASLPMVHAKRIPADGLHDTALPEYPAMTRASMSGLMGDVHGIKPKEISDAFVAKMFATRAFSLDLVIRGLSFFALDKLGPIAVRELAVRAGSPVEFGNTLGSLKTMDIGISNAPYCRLVQNLASEGQSELFHALLASDQHPEAYEDTATQEALLTSFLEAGNWTQAHITLLCLSLAGVQQQAAAWNLIAQYYLRQRQHRLVAQTIQHLQAQKAPLTFTTLTYLHRYLLPIRRRRKRPIESQRQDKPPFNALDFVTSACMYADDVARRDGRPENYVRPRVWRELLKRHGMTHRWPGFTKLVLWLVERYSGPRFQQDNKSASSAVQLWPSCPLHFIFDRQMQQALFTWGFRSAAVRHQLHPAPCKRIPTDMGAPGPGGSQPERNGTATWAQGLVLLLHLRSRGVNVVDADVWRAFRLRMWILFGPGHSTLAINEVTRQRNHMSLAHYIRTANDIWPGGLVQINPMLLGDGEDEALQLQPQLLLAFFGRQMRVGWRRGERSQEYADVRSWAQAVEASRWSEGRRGRTAAQRLWVWERSPFRVCVSKGERGSPEGKGTGMGYESSAARPPQQDLPRPGDPNSSRK